MPKLLDSMIPPIINEHLERCTRQPTIPNQAAVSNRRFGNPLYHLSDAGGLEGGKHGRVWVRFLSPQLGVTASWTKYLVVKLPISGRSKVNPLITKDITYLESEKNHQVRTMKEPPATCFFHLTLVHGVTYTLIVFDPWSWQNGEGWSTNHDWLYIYIYKYI